MYDKWNDPEFMELFRECHEEEWREEDYYEKHGYSCEGIYDDTDD